MKKLIVALMVLTTLASCGKKNTTDTGTGAISATSPITVTGAVETQLASIIDNSQFGTGQATYYETWNQVLAHQPNVTFKFGNVSSSTNTDCIKIGGVCILNYYTSSSFSNSSSITVTRTVANSTSVDVISAKKNELKAIINARNYIQASGSSFYIRTNDGRSIIIDTRYPLFANPVSTQQANGTGEVFVGAE